MHVRHPWRSRMAAIGLGAAVLTTLTGCELPDVSMSPTVTTASETAARSSAAPRSAAAGTAAVVGERTPERPSGDLDAGTLTRALKAGSRTVVVDYWTDEDATAWTAEGTKSVQIAAHVELAEDDVVDGDGDERLMKVTRFAATLDDGQNRSAIAEDRGEFAIMPPYSYTTALTVPPSPPETAELVLYVQFDLLVETEPGSEVFFRQTVLDTVRLPLIEENSP